MHGASVVRTYIIHDDGDDVMDGYCSSLRVWLFCFHFQARAIGSFRNGLARTYHVQTFEFPLLLLRTSF